MSKLSTYGESSKNDVNLKYEESTFFDLKLISKKVKIKYSVYKISTQLKNMCLAETDAISKKAILFTSADSYEKGTLLRVWIEIPDYWSKKAKYVEYRHTDAPTHFQILSRVLNCDEHANSKDRYQLLCENLNIDEIDENVLDEFLVSNTGEKFK